MNGGGLIMDKSKQHARFGLFYLKEAVLELLFNRQDVDPLRTTEIRDQLGLPHENAGEPEHLIKGVLHHLHNDGYVEKDHEPNSPVKWKITNDGIQAL